MKDRIVFKSGEFIDFTGKTRLVTFCAVSIEEECLVTPIRDFLLNVPEITNDLTVKKIVLGVAVQNPSDDKVNLELAKTIAEGKARKFKSSLGALYSTNKGMINYRVVEALLEQELDFFQHNPGNYIAGYNKDKELYLKDPSKYYAKYSK